MGTNMHRGPIAWMAKNSVAANILLLILLAGGLIQLSTIKQEIFPEFSLDFVTVNIAYPGASPEEIESGILLVLEEAVRGVDGVKRVTSSASEGIGSANIELLLNADPKKALDDIKSAVDQITSFPESSEKPTVQIISAKNEVISLVIYGHADEQELRSYGEKAREGLLLDSNITLVNLIGSKKREIAVEVPKQNLIAHKITLGEIAQKLSQASIEIPAGQLKTSSQNLALRTNDRLNFGYQYQDVILKSNFAGEQLRVGDIAKVSERFEESDQEARYNGQPAIMVRVFRTGEQKPTKIAEQVKSFAQEFEQKLPSTLKLALWNDYSVFLSGRIELLIKNALLGLILVFIIIGLFLEARLAFWVTMGIPASFMGAFLLLPYFGVSVNMISLFAFIITLGMVVDDAIVVGENIYDHRRNQEPLLYSSIRGAKEIAAPVIFAILTTIAAFSPLFYVPGIMGKFFYVIPIIVVLVLLMSLIESLLILPNHLAHTKSSTNNKGFWGVITKYQRRFSDNFLIFISTYYRPVAVRVVQHRYVTLSLGLGILILVVGLIGSGHLAFSFMPKMDSDIILLHAEYDIGSPKEKSLALEKNLLSAADRALSKLGGPEKAQGFYSQIGSQITPGGPAPKGSGADGAHIVDIMVYLAPTDERNFSSEDFTTLWQEELGEIPGLKSLVFKSTTGPSAGKPISVQLKHSNILVLETQAKKLARHLSTYSGVTSIEDGVSQGKEQIEFKLKESARQLNLSSRELASQIRHAFYGAEALRQQRNRDEVKVMVRLPKSERQSIFNIENFRVQTPQSQVMLKDVAKIKRGFSYAQISREDGARVITVSADILEGQANANQIMADIKKNYLPQIIQENPGLSFGEAGEQREQSDALKSLGMGFLFSMLLIYALLAVPLKSYVQPLIIMSAIPFGLVGAAFGHMLMGFNLSIISMMGLVALSGIVVNDSLVFIHAANNRVARGLDIKSAIIEAGVRRFRPILLTSLTTFFGLMPMILETSLQARFLIPMAISIGFGVMFATFIILLLVPALYVITYDLVNIFSAKNSGNYVSQNLQAEKQ